jgi:RNA polymerase sigma factor (sigma-70 family)
VRIIVIDALPPLPSVLRLFVYSESGSGDHGIWVRLIRGRWRLRRKGMSSEEISGMTDAGLVVAIARWRHEALAEAYRRHGGGVFGLARHLLGDSEAAKDVAQEVFLRLWKQPERFDPSRGSLRSYLLVQTHGRSVDVLRSETARRVREERDVRTAVAVMDDVERQVEDWEGAPRYVKHWRGCPRRSGGRSPSPFLLEIPTGRSPACSGNPKAPSKAAFARGCAVCACP